MAKYMQKHLTVVKSKYMTCSDLTGLAFDYFQSSLLSTLKLLLNLSGSFAVVLACLPGRALSLRCA